MLTKKEAVDLLAEFDHGFINPDGVKKITEPFGFVGTTYMAKANPNEIKGLSLFDEEGNPIDEAEGQDAAELAKEICQRVGVSYVPMFGRGSQLRACVSALKDHLIEEERG